MEKKSVVRKMAALKHFQITSTQVELLQTVLLEWIQSAVSAAVQFVSVQPTVVPSQCCHQ